METPSRDEQVIALAMVMACMLKTSEDLSPEDAELLSETIFPNCLSTLAESMGGSQEEASSLINDARRLHIEIKGKK